MVHLPKSPFVVHLIWNIVYVKLFEVWPESCKFSGKFRARERKNVLFAWLVRNKTFSFRFKATMDYLKTILSFSPFLLLFSITVNWFFPQRYEFKRRVTGQPQRSSRVATLRLIKLEPKSQLNLSALELIQSLAYWQTSKWHLYVIQFIIRDVRL